MTFKEIWESCIEELRLHKNCHQHYFPYTLPSLFSPEEQTNVSTSGINKRFPFLFPFQMYVFVPCSLSNNKIKSRRESWKNKENKTERFKVALRYWYHLTKYYIGSTIVIWIPGSNLGPSMLSGTCVRGRATG